MSDRTKYLGCSEVAAVLGLSPFRSQFDVWAAKVGLTGRTEDNRVQRRGKYLEPGLLRWLGDEVGADSIESGPPLEAEPLRAPQWPAIAGHPDGYLVMDGRRIGAEIKTTKLTDEWGAGGDEIPAHYWLQCQAYLAITGLDEWAVGVFLTFRDEFRTFRIALDAKLAHEALERAQQWWLDFVVTETPPPVDASPGAAAWLKDRFPRQRQPLRDATDDEARLIRRVARLKALDRRVWKAKEQAEADLKVAIGDAEGLRFGKSKATWKAQGGARIDVKRLRAELPDIAEQYTNTTESRVLRVSYKEER